jgi:hypothetical protein
MPTCGSRLVVKAFAYAKVARANLMGKLAEHLHRVWQLSPNCDVRSRDPQRLLPPIAAGAWRLIWTLAILSSTISKLSTVMGSGMSRGFAGRAIGKFRPNSDLMTEFQTETLPKFGKARKKSLGRCDAGRALVADRLISSFRHAVVSDPTSGVRQTRRFN